MSMKLNTYLAGMNKAYLFAEIAARVSAYTKAHPDQEIIRLGIGDVTRPLTPHVAKAFADAALAMGTPEGFHGYPPYEGYDFLLDAIIAQEYAARGDGQKLRSEVSAEDLRHAPLQQTRDGARGKARHEEKHRVE